MMTLIAVLHFAPHKWSFLSAAPHSFCGLVHISDFKLPPIEKIYEAYSAIADSRIILKENEAEVESSDLSKKYLVTWKDDVYTSNDNASYWKGYLGYPIIAVLMLQKRLSFSNKIAQYFKGINWKQLNTANKNNYAKVVKQVLDELAETGVDCEKINQEIEKVYTEIKELKIKSKRSSLRPPK